MKKAIMDEWKKLKQSTINKAICDIPDRIRRMILAKGGSIKSIK